MKYTSGLSLLSLVFALTALVACGDDDSPTQPSTPLKDQIVGTWIDSDGDEWTFKSDGTFIDWEGDEGTWKVEGTTMTWSYMDLASISFEVKISGDRMTVSLEGEEDILTRKK